MRTAVVIMLEHRMHSRTQGAQLCPTRRVDVGGCELAVRAPQDFDPIHLVLAAHGDDLAVPRMSASLHPLQLRIVDIPHRGGRPLAYGVPARAVPAAVVFRVNGHAVSRTKAEGR